MNQKKLRQSKRLLYQQALIAHDGKIKPCGNSTDWNDCFTLYKDRLYFWYNTTDDSTHVINTQMRVEGSESASDQA